MKHRVFVMAAGPSHEFQSVTDVPKPFIRVLNESLLNTVIRNSGVEDHPDVDISVLFNKKHTKFLDHSPLRASNAKAYPIENVRHGAVSTLISAFLTTCPPGNTDNGFWVMSCDRFIPDFSVSLLDRITSVMLDSRSRVGTIVCKTDPFPAGMGEDIDVLKFSGSGFSFKQGSDKWIGPHALSGMYWFRSPAILSSMVLDSGAIRVDHLSFRELLDSVLYQNTLHVDRVDTRLVALSTPERLNTFAGSTGWLEATTSFYNGQSLKN